jgi:SAM-dependent methyltransferase
MKRLLIIGVILLAACDALSGGSDTGGAAATGQSFPKASRPVSAIISDRWSTEEERDRIKEAPRVMDIAGVKPGMSVADIGAGEGYYTIRLATRVGPKGRVLAQDIFPAVRDKLADRVVRERLDNVSVMLGTSADPKLPDNSFDRVMMIHMYHEIADPYEFLWRLRPSLRAGGQVIVVDADRPTDSHGTPPKLLECEMNAVGYQRVKSATPVDDGIFLMSFTPSGPRPEPGAIKVCAA